MSGIGDSSMWEVSSYSGTSSAQSVLCSLSLQRMVSIFSRIPSSLERALFLGSKEENEVQWASQEANEH